MRQSPNPSSLKTFGGLSFASITIGYKPSDEPWDLRIDPLRRDSEISLWIGIRTGMLAHSMLPLAGRKVAKSELRNRVRQEGIFEIICGC